MFNGKSVTGPRRPEIAERSKAEDISCIPGDQNGVALGTTLPPPGFPLRKRFERLGVNGRRVEDDIIVNRQHAREVRFNSIFDHDCHGADPAHTFGSGSMAGYGGVSQTLSMLVWPTSRRRHSCAWRPTVGLRTISETVGVETFLRSLLWRLFRFQKSSEATNERLALFFVLR